MLLSGITTGACDIMENIRNAWTRTAPLIASVRYKYHMQWDIYLLDWPKCHTYGLRLYTHATIISDPCMGVTTIGEYMPGPTCREYVVCFAEDPYHFECNVGESFHEDQGVCLPDPTCNP